MGIITKVQRLFRGVEDPAINAEDHANPRHFVYYTIENASFQKWVVFVASVGFLTDAYDIFALNFVTQILPHIYWTKDGHLGSKQKAALYISTFAGILAGQALFGFLGDRFGRRKMYGLELITLIVGSIGTGTVYRLGIQIVLTAMAAEGQFGSMDILGWLVWWRLFMGVGIGADYPLSAVITSEFAPRRYRARMLAFVFWMQPIGQTIVFSIALIVIKISQPSLSCTIPIDQSPDYEKCARQLDMAWRWVVGLGAVPAAVAIFFRLTIPQSPRYLLDNANEFDLAVRKTAAYFGTSNQGPLSAQVAQATSLMPKTEPDNLNTPDTGVTANHHHNGSNFQLPEPAQDFDDRYTLERRQSVISAVSTRSSVVRDSRPDTRQSGQEGGSKAQHDYWKGFYDYFVTERNWPLLVGTAGTWFLLDIPFYGLGLSYNAIADALWQQDGNTCRKEQFLYDKLFNSLWHQLVIVAAGSLLGGGVFLKLIKHVSPKTLQFWGFIVLTALLLVTGAIFKTVANGGNILIGLYILIQFFFNLGPNSTTYLIPAELFPTRYRCFSHGLSAASGRLGAIVAQLFMIFGKIDGHTLASAAEASTTTEVDQNSCPNDAKETLGNVLMVLCVFMALGAGLTWYLTPETRDKDGNARSLETLAKGYEHLKQLGRETDPEDRVEGT